MMMSLFGACAGQVSRYGQQWPQDRDERWRLDIRRRHHARHELIGCDRRIIALNHSASATTESFVRDDVDTPFALESSEPIRTQDRQQYRVCDVVRLDASQVNLRPDSARLREIAYWKRARHAAAAARAPPSATRQLTLGGGGTKTNGCCCACCACCGPCCARLRLAVRAGAAVPPAGHLPVRSRESAAALREREVDGVAWKAPR